ncbi:MAG: hypothetical protein AAFY98_04940 [Verrucomicrobiota bacterium]
MKTTKEKRTRCLRVRLTPQEEQELHSRFQKRKIPGLVRALLLEREPPQNIKEKSAKADPIQTAYFLGQLESIARSVNGTAQLNAAEKTKILSILMGIIEEVETDRGH